MIKKKQKMKVSAGKVAMVGAGVAAIGAGGYYLFGPKGKKHQQKLKSWTADMEIEVKKKLQKVKVATKPAYESMIDALATTYSKKYGQYATEIHQYAEKIKSELKAKPKIAKKIAKKSIPKKAKRIVK